MTLAQVKEFNTIYEVPVSDVPTTRVPADKLRYSLIEEEFGELVEAIENFDIVEIADALGDIQYVTHGAIDVFGLESVLDYVDTITYLEGHLHTRNGQEPILDGLKTAILRNHVEDVAGILKGILELVEQTAKYFNIDLDYVVAVIHKSNLTKLGEDGKAIRRPEDNKVMKGPNYKEPTGDIRAYLYDGVKDAELLG